MTNNLSLWRKKAYLKLKPISDTADIEIFAVLGHILKKDPSWVLTHPDDELSDFEVEALDHLISRLQQLEPLAFVIGHSEFYGRQFNVTPDVLIPRPETELMIDEALSWFKEKEKPNLILDVGTGSGCIALTLLAEWKRAFSVMTDNSYVALKVAKMNAESLGIERISLVNCHLADPLYQRFDLVCANLPYIPTQAVKTLPHAIYEPHNAFDGGTNGVDLMVELIQKLPNLVTHKSLVLMEFQFDQGNLLRELAGQVLPNANCSIIQDLNKHDRLMRLEM